jgi:hypothetical protein
MTAGQTSQFQAGYGNVSHNDRLRGRVILAANARRLLEHDEQRDHDERRDHQQLETWPPRVARFNRGWLVIYLALYL